MKKFGFKVIILGDEAVGKTSLVIRFVNDSFSEQYKKTIGADFLIKDLNLYNAVFRLVIWDLAGERHWSYIRERYMKGADGCILIFDTSREQNLKEYISHWTEETHRFLGDSIPLTIVGNKIDLESGINLREAAHYIGTLHHPYAETSAKTGAGVDKMFTQITDLIIESKPKIQASLKDAE
jgi:small GTP-binding protein